MSAPTPAAHTPSYDEVSRVLAEPRRVYDASIAEARRVFDAATAEPRRVFDSARAEALHVYDAAMAEALVRAWASGKGYRATKAGAR